jgi:hypothetical protein
MKLPNAAVLTSTAIVRSYQAGSPVRGTCRTIEFRSDAKHPQGMRDVDYATVDRLISFKQTHRISVQLAVAKTA